ncbi:MAG: site-2 protease family protein [Dehalococcoidia bacterium]|nr:site-2 protease family protein [Dehalococcoidia bacterium]
MFRGNIRVGAVLGIPLEFNLSWLITLALFTFLLGDQVYPDVLRDEPAWFSWLLAAVSGIFFFASIIIHELAHSLIARRSGIPVRAITLFMLGGVSQITREARRPLVEFVMAIVGPLTSIALAGVFLGLAYAPGLRDNRTGVMWEWLFLMNLSLGIVNMAPGFPLDGGRVLRAALWGITGNYRQATRWASLCGRGLGYALIAGGFLVLLRVVPWLDPFSGIWLILVGFFLDNAARQSWAHTRLLEELRTRPASSIMQTVLPRVAPEVDLLQAMSRYYHPRDGMCAFVVDGDEHVLGMVTDVQLARVPRDRWPSVPVGAAMQPADEIATTTSGADLASVLEEMDGSQQTQLPVLEDGRLTGWVSRARLTGLFVPQPQVATSA